MTSPDLARAADYPDCYPRNDPAVWLSAPVEELLTDEGHVVGVRTTRAGRTLRVHARRGVVMGGGGFDHNAEWRRRYQGVHGSASSGSRGNVGTAIGVGQEAGAEVDLMDDAWWGGSIPASAAGGSPGFLVSERSMPQLDHRGRRRRPVHQRVGGVRGPRTPHMFEHAETVPGTCWMITDVRHARRYLRSYALDPRPSRR